MACECRCTKSRRRNVYMSTLASSNECFLSVAFITASSTIYINGVVAARQAWPIVWLLLPSVGLQLITELQRLNQRRFFKCRHHFFVVEANQTTHLIHNNQLRIKDGQLCRMMRRMADYYRRRWILTLCFVEKEVKHMMSGSGDRISTSNNQLMHG